MPDLTEVLQLRISKADAKQLDKFVRDTNRKDPRKRATRASVLRDGLYRMLAEHVEARS
jgi:hypothetical protein